MARNPYDPLLNPNDPLVKAERLFHSFEFKNYYQKYNGLSTNENSDQVNAATQVGQLKEIRGYLDQAGVGPGALTGGEHGKLTENVFHSYEKLAEVTANGGSVKEINEAKIGVARAFLKQIEAPGYTGGALSARKDKLEMVYAILKETGQSPAALDPEGKRIDLEMQQVLDKVRDLAKEDVKNSSREATFRSWERLKHPFGSPVSQNTDNSVPATQVAKAGPAPETERTI